MNTIYFDLQSGGVAFMLSAEVFGVEINGWIVHWINRRDHPRRWGWFSPHRRSSLTSKPILQRMFPQIEERHLLTTG